MEFVSFPLWTIVSGVAVAIALGVFLYVRKGDTSVLHNAVDLFDDSPLDLAITDLARGLSDQDRKFLLDIASVLSPATTLTTDDLDDKTKKILMDYLNAK